MPPALPCKICHRSGNGGGGANGFRIAATVAGYDAYGGYSVVAPSGTANGILEKVSAGVVKAVREPGFGAQRKGLGIDLTPGSRTALAAFRRDETERFVDRVRAAGAELK